MLAQSHAALSMRAGVMAFVIDRRTSSDDNRGVGQSLNDNLHTRVRLPIGCDDVITRSSQTQSRLLLEKVTRPRSALHASTTSATAQRAHDDMEHPCACARHRRRWSSDVVARRLAFSAYLFHTTDVAPASVAEWHKAVGRSVSAEFVAASLDH